MHLEPGTQWLRVAVLTPTNLGAASGTAAVDRPTQAEPWHGLPYLPDSALQGSLAAPLGSPGPEGLATSGERQRLFGSPDRLPEADEPDAEPTWGRPGALVVGNGELVAFPLPGTDRRPVWVAPALHVGRLLALDERESEALPGLVAHLEEKPERAWAAPAWTPLDADIDLETLTLGESERQSATALAGWVRETAGLPGPAPVLLVAARTAGRLWRAAAEVRSGTALDPGRRTARSGSLRTVELVPPGTVFLARLDHRGEAPTPPLADRLQLGSGEAAGLGWASLDRLERLPALPAEGSTDAPPGAPEPGEQRIRGPRIMATMHEAVSGLAGRGEPELAGRARAAVYGFGPRLQRFGVAGALGFSIAKARPSDPEPGPEARVHRWLLGRLLDLDGAGVEPGPAPALTDWLAAGPFYEAGGGVEALGTELLARWGWLRRASELGLRLEEEGA